MRPLTIRYLLALSAPEEMLWNMDDNFLFVHVQCSSFDICSMIDKKSKSSMASRFCRMNAHEWRHRLGHSLAATLLRQASPHATGRTGAVLWGPSSPLSDPVPACIQDTSVHAFSSVCFPHRSSFYTTLNLVGCVFKKTAASSPATPSLCRTCPPRTVQQRPARH